MYSVAKVLLPIVALAAVACDQTAHGSEKTAATSNSSGIVDIQVNDSGFTPSSVSATKGKPLTLRFKRTTDATCAKEVDFPELGIKKDLPLDQPVTIEIPTTESRTLAFQCGMGMYKSSVVVR